MKHHVPVAVQPDIIITKLFCVIVMLFITTMELMKFVQTVTKPVKVVKILRLV